MAVPETPRQNHCGPSLTARPRLAYLLRDYPRFSETFIVNEILALEALGCDLSILALRKPDDGMFHESVARVRTRAEYLPDAGAKLRGKTSGKIWTVFRESPRGWWRARSTIWKHTDLARADLRAAIYVLHWMKKRRIEHVHVHFGSDAAAIAMLAAMIAGMRFSMTLHAYDIYRDDVDRALLARKIEHAAMVVTVTEFNRRYLLEHCPAAKDKVVVHYNGVDLTRFAPGGLPREPGLIFSVGRLIEKKGFAHLIRAAGLLRDRGVAVRCVIAGDGADADKLREEIKRLNLRKHVELAGPLKQDEVMSLMQRASCFALPCIQARNGNVDALPTVLLESLASGCPSVSTTVSGIPEIIEDGVSGLLVEPGNDAALAAAIERVLKDADLAARLAVGGRRRAEDRFDASRNAVRLKLLLEAAARGECRSLADTTAPAENLAPMTPMLEMPAPPTSARAGT